ncbi:MAG: RluA family pseudouridine synthase [Chitinophagaceae bacterium]
MTSSGNLNIVLENDRIVSLNKPSGLLSVPDRFDANLPSLKKLLRDRYGEIFVVHRLDRETSGLILFAKDEETHRYFSKVFEEHQIEKTYLGIVHGTPLQVEGTIDKPIAEHGTIKGKMIIHKRGKPSITHYRVLDNFGSYTLMEFKIESGRTHQIRVHMQDLGHPIVCDPLYGLGEPIFLSKIKKNFKLSKKEEEERPLLGRLALHSFRLEFVEPQGNKIRLEAEMPKDLFATIQQLKKRH